jgi:polyisoprenoid-binding protein YceI
LRSDDFFAVDTHPTLTFTSSRVVKTGDDSYDVVGTLTIRGVAKEITMPVTYLGTAKDPCHEGPDRIAPEMMRKIPG